MTAAAVLGLLVSCAAVDEEPSKDRRIADTSARRLIENVPRDATEARFVYEDVERFLRAHAVAEDSDDPAGVYQTEYLDQASLGLQMYVSKYDLTAERLAAAVVEHPEAYERLPRTLAALREHEGGFRAAYAEIERIMPSAVFPPTYFVVAGHRGIGSGSTEGPLISIEKETVDSVRGDLVATLVHEMIHMEQLAAQKEGYFAIFAGEKRTLLATCIREGTAMYFSDLITGGSEHKALAWDYLLAHEDELWPRFAAEMHGSDMGDWLWETPADPEQPQDVGYAIGARIVQTLYESADDKAAAIDSILAVTAYPALLAASGYPANAVER